MKLIPRSMWAADYVEYLNSFHWKAKRQLVVDRADGHCERCRKATKRFQVHHKTYDRQGDELLTDLEALCARCHMKEHGIIPLGPKKKRPTRKPSSKPRHAARSPQVLAKRERRKKKLARQAARRATNSSLLAGPKPTKADIWKDLRKRGLL